MDQVVAQALATYERITKADAPATAGDSIELVRETVEPAAREAPERTAVAGNGREAESSRPG